MDKHCGELDAYVGFCEWLPSGCTKQYAPVCGCDGKTYDNACIAHLNGASVRHDGTCKPDLAQCEFLREATQKALRAAKGCAPSLPVVQCTVPMHGLAPCGCSTYVNEHNIDAINTLKKLTLEWDKLGCEVYWDCAQCVPPSSGACDGTTGACVDRY
ncbi:MAG: hypothetical protein JRH20_18475 [Deltaproteobacteria bacterium]|nr:hypothetical protein [Deltaproteobacteria bacterium]